MRKAIIFFIAGVLCRTVTKNKGTLPIKELSGKRVTYKHIITDRDSETERSLEEEIARVRKNIPYFTINTPKTYRVYQKYAVSTENVICSQIGSRIIRRGGNAMDAAVAAAICIGTLNSFSSGIGGGGFMLVYKKAKDSGKESAFSYDFREVAPAKIQGEFFKKNPDEAKEGGMSVGVPGEIMGLYTAHREHGKLPWRDLFVESIIVARKFSVTDILEAKLDRNRKHILADPGLRETFSRSGTILRKGDSVTRLNYSRTLQELAEDPMSFYKGRIADRIVKLIRERGGVMEKKDLTDYKVKTREPLTIGFYGYKVFTTPLPTGGPLVLEALKILEKLDIRRIRASVADGNLVKLYHMLIETYKFIGADRGELGDPDFQSLEKKVKTVLSDDNAHDVAKKMDMSGSHEKTTYGMLCPFCEDHGTTHVNVVDEDGLIVQITSTINLEFGSKMMDPETGILFNNQIDDFFIPGVDNAYDLPKASTNIVKPKKRPFSSASPTILIGENDKIVIGAAGGTRIPTAILNAIVYMVLGLGIDQAVHGVRIHEQLVPATVYVESFFPKPTAEGLEKLGHTVKESKENTLFTSVQAIHVISSEAKGGSRRIYAVADSRKGGATSGS